MIVLLIAAVLAPSVMAAESSEMSKPALTLEKAVTFICDLVLMLVGKTPDFLDKVVESAKALASLVNASINVYDFFDKHAMKSSKHVEGSKVPMASGPKDPTILIFFKGSKVKY